MFVSFDVTRQLPTFRFDENTTDDVKRLLYVTNERFKNFLDDNEEPEWLPPFDVINSIVRVNTQKRETAFLRAVDEAEGAYPPQTTINSIMNYGGAIPGVDDRYLDADYPSHEVFAYNRLGKRSMLNRKFGKRCIEAMRYAYPASIEKGQFESLRARVHRIVDTADEPLAVVSTKETIDHREYNGRTSLLVSRVTGVARLDHDAFDVTTRQAIETLADHKCGTDRLMGAKALLTDFIRSCDDTDAIVPVIQTMYQTQR